MSISVSEFAIVVLVTGLLLGGLFYRYRWARWLAAIVLVAHAAQHFAGDAHGLAVLGCGLGILLGPPIIRRITDRQTKPA